MSEMNDFGKKMEEIKAEITKEKETDIAINESALILYEGALLLRAHIELRVFRLKNRLKETEFLINELQNILESSGSG